MTYPVGPGVHTLARRLHELMTTLPGSVRVHLLGHSVGGVVARYYAQEMGDARIVQTISMASPFAGVQRVRWLGVDVARDLDPRSRLLRQLRLGSRRAISTPHLSLIAENDAVVSAPMSHALPGGDVTLIRRCGHNTMLYHEETADHVCRRIVDFSARPQRGGSLRSREHASDLGESGLHFSS
jgi:pimeloyl-ACP methyl ester carboxylesterase